MRGKELLKRSDVQQYRITPAYAGKRTVPIIWNWHTQDHPRLCGEKFDAPSYPALEAGSPPPMRGKAGMAALLTTGKGITPAYAGKS